MKFNLILMALALAGHLWISTVGWDNDIVDLQPFRQTQTAISCFYYLKDGFSIAYQTPITGSPWLLPFEFPLYQLLTGWLKLHSGISLESAGRIVSILFFYLTLPLIRPFLRVCGLPVKAAPLSIALLVSSPIYLFWTRTFLIESTSLFLTVAFVVLAGRAAESRTALSIAAAVLIGALAASVKVTTFALGWVLCAACFIPRRLSREALLSAGLLLTPVALGLVWTAYADALKHDSVLAQLFTSSNQRGFIFGEWRDRFSFARAIGVARYSLPFAFGCVKGIQVLLMAVIAGVLVWQERANPRLLLLSAIFPMAPLLFLGLYATHTYYWYENTWCLLLALGVVLSKESRAAQLIGAFICLQMWLGYGTRDYPQQACEVHVRNAAFFRVVREQTAAESVLLILGEGCDSTIPYYCQRRAIMKPMETTAALYQRALEQNRGARIAGLVLGAGATEAERAQAADLIKQLQLEATPWRYEGARLWIKR